MNCRACYSKEKISGMMFGLFLGDAIGALFCDQQSGEIPLLDLDTVAARRPSFYTDDTQMAISVLEEMAEHGSIDPLSLRKRFVNRFTSWRNYGGGMLEVVELWRASTDSIFAAEKLYNGQGSFGNGAATRVAPISAFFKYTETDELLHQVTLCTCLTHTHPYGIAGAQLQAYGVLMALNDIPAEEWLPAVFKLPIESAFKIKLGLVKQCLENRASAYESSQIIGNGSEAIEAVPAALYAHLRYPDSFVDAVLFAIAMGGDTDTIGAMTGALSGSKNGLKSLPKKLLSNLENETEGSDFIQRLIATVSEE